MTFVPRCGRQGQRLCPPVPAHPFSWAAGAPARVHTRCSSPRPWGFWSPPASQSGGSATRGSNSSPLSYSASRFTQAAFLGHDGGHQQMFASRRANDLLGRAMGNLLVGLSYGWWVDKHNRHHANPNKENHDPDIGDGVLAFTTGQVAARTGGVGRRITRWQAWLFFPLLTLEGMNLHVASVRSLLPGAVRSARGGRRSTEAILLAVHVIVFVGGLLLVMSPLKALAFAALNQAVFGFYMGCSFAPNHKGMPTLAPRRAVGLSAPPGARHRAMCAAAPSWTWCSVR